MLNRQQRRALERAAKRTHKLEPQVCVLWVPAARGYLSSFTPHGFTVAGHGQAQRFCTPGPRSGAVRPTGASTGASGN